MTNVIWVDDNKQAGRGTARRLERGNPDVSVTAVYSAAEAREHLERSDVDVVVSGHELPDGDSKEVFRAAQELQPDASLVLYSDDPGDGEHTGSGDYRWVERDGEASYRELERSVLETEPRVSDLEDLDFRWSRLQDALDRVAEIAAVTLEAKAAFLTLRRDDGDVIVASYGIESANIPGDAVHPETSDGVVTVTDVRSDPRFKGSFYTHFGIQSFMAASIHASSDAVLCVVDDRRRDFNPEETYLLRTIAAEAEDQLRLRRKYVEARNRERPPRVDTN